MWICRAVDCEGGWPIGPWQVAAHAQLWLAAVLECFGMQQPCGTPTFCMGICCQSAGPAGLALMHLKLD